MIRGFCTSSDLDILCSRVMSIGGVRFCAVRDVTGNTLAGGQKLGIPRIESNEERATSAVRMGLVAGMLESMPASFGRARSIAIEFDRITMHVFPLDQNRFLQATSEPRVTNVKEEIKRLISMGTNK